MLVRCCTEAIAENSSLSPLLFLILIRLDLLLTIVDVSSTARHLALQAPTLGMHHVDPLLLSTYLCADGNERWVRLVKLVIGDVKGGPHIPQLKLIQHVTICLDEAL